MAKHGSFCFNTANRAATARQVEGNLFQGDLKAYDEVLPIVYEDLRKLASKFVKEVSSDSLPRTQLVEEVVMRFMGFKNLKLKDDVRFMAIAAQAFRRILVAHACKLQAAPEASFNVNADVAAKNSADLLALHNALDDLGKNSPRHAKVVELRYFGGLTSSEIAEALDMSPSAAERNWREARLWIRRRLRP